MQQHAQDFDNWSKSFQALYRKDAMRAIAEAEQMARGLDRQERALRCGTYKNLALRYRLAGHPLHRPKPYLFAGVCVATAIGWVLGFGNMSLLLIGYAVVAMGAHQLICNRTANGFSCLADVLEPTSSQDEAPLAPDTNPSRGLEMIDKAEQDRENSNRFTESAIARYERIIKAATAMTDAEKVALAEWEVEHVTGSGDHGTSDWPGWEAIINRISH
ncbi:hypothetical protein H8F21_14270 [Pseudomonas sp. P66]|uniref:SLATT domain-containing protein n=1 Tax=Pseudomonas arcuscaelestis TaxID=2710591 RepID=A0ABS2BYN0_9PSED|nr:hypothetical protein [Pseudomonas arcuscaelestis]MBM5458729.1 hypothetical protein [Pseudomonas arcuscaelestis]